MPCAVRAFGRFHAPQRETLPLGCRQTHLLEQLRHNLLEALHNHGVGRLRALAAPDLLLRTQLRAVEVDAAATTIKRQWACTSHIIAMALHTTLPMAAHCYLRCESGRHSLLAAEPSLLSLRAQHACYRCPGCWT